MSYINQEDLFEKTNGGLDVILWKYPNAQAAVDKRGTKFKVRDSEKTASASLKKMPDGTYVVTDFGGDQKPRNAIQVLMHEDNVDFKTAINIIAERFNISSDVKKQTLAKSEFTKRDATEEEEEGHYYFDVKEKFSEADLKEIFAEKVIEQVVHDAEMNKAEDPYYKLREVLNRYKCYSLNSFRQIKDRKALVTGSSDEYPIFMFDFGGWKKIYQPKNADKAFRFRYVGERPKDYIFGLQQCTKAFDELQKVDEDMDADPDEKEAAKEKLPKLEEIILCSGDRDSLNVAAMGYWVVWLNSESAKLNGAQYGSIARLCKSFYNLPDIDRTGVRQAHELAMIYLELKTIWLPAELEDRRDFRGNPCKDVRDYFRFYNRKHFEDLIKVALPYQFWDEVKKYNKKGDFIGYDYMASNTRVYNFLSRNGFVQLKTQNEEEDIYVKITGNVVKEVKEKDIRKYINDFLQDRKFNIKLRDAFYRSKQITGTSFENLPYRSIDFKDFGKDFQFMFFQNKVWKISAEKIEEFRHGEVPKYVWDQEVIPHRVELLPDFFTVKFEKETEEYSIEITNNECLLFKFLQNSCRMFWKIEELGHEEKSEAGSKILRKELTAEEKNEQDMHLINRIYTLGYLMHRYKDPSRPWAPWALENKVTEESTSSGGSGKSLFMNIPTFFMKHVVIGARDSRITENKHLMENVTEHTDYVHIEDCNEYLNFSFFYPMLTGAWTINPKNTRSFPLPYAIAPKMGFSSNYYPRSVDQSTERRLIYTVFSDFYHHGPNDEFPEERSPKSDFGKNLFDDFTEAEWNMAINLGAQCLKMYLKYGKINPPMSNVTKRKLMTIMSDEFKNWADVYFSVDSGRLDKPFVRDEVQEECLKKNNLKTWKPQRFRKAMQAWCKMNGYILNPKEMANADGRIIEKVDNVTREIFFIKTKDAVEPVAEVKAVPFKTSTDTNDIPF